MRQIRHPLSGAIYEYADDGEGPVVVTKGDSTGRFTKDGVWLSGAVRSADPEMCRWIASGGPTASRAARGSRRLQPTPASGGDSTSGERG